MLREYVIYNPEQGYIYGNKTYTTEMKYARRFTKREAEFHLESWGSHLGYVLEATCL